MAKFEGALKLKPSIFLSVAIVISLFPARIDLAYSSPNICSLSPKDVSNLYTIKSSSGDVNLDSALQSQLISIMKLFKINPGLKFFDDANEPAIYTCKNSFVRYTSGTIYFGITMITSEMAKSRGGAAVAGIAAHECAHVLQFYSKSFSKLRQQGTDREMELHADFMAGYYFGAKKRSDGSLEAFLASLFDKGDAFFDDVQHHGTPEERVAAVREGFDMHASGRSLDEAFEAGIDYVNGN